MDPTVAGALIGFGGTFAAATTTQVLMGRRQQADLCARMEADRALRDLDEGRRVVDTALVRASELNDLLRAVFRAADAQDLLDRIDEDRDVGDPPNIEGGLSDLVRQFHEAGNAALHAAQQLEVRFGATELASLYKDTVSGFILSVVQINRAAGAINRERAGEHVLTAGLARESFVAEAYRILGLALTPTETRLSVDQRRQVASFPGEETDSEVGSSDGRGDA